MKKTQESIEAKSRQIDSHLNRYDLHYYCIYLQICPHQLKKKIVLKDK